MQALERVLESIKRTYGLTQADLSAKCRKRDLVIPRQVAMHYLRRNTKMTLHQIAEEFNHDHSTVIHSVREVEKFLDQNDERVTATYKNLKRGLNQLLCNTCTALQQEPLRIAA